MLRYGPEMKVFPSVVRYKMRDPSFGLLELAKANVYSAAQHILLAADSEGLASAQLYAVAEVELTEAVNTVEQLHKLAARGI